MQTQRQLMRHSFEVWLRTGRVPVGRVEYKFNGWHDPDDGKFTEVGAGRYFPPGSGSATGGERLAMTRAPRKKPDGTWQGGGFTGGGAGSFGGAGATGPGWETPTERQTRERQNNGRGRSLTPDRLKSRTTLVSGVRPAKQSERI